MVNLVLDGHLNANLLYKFHDCDQFLNDDTSEMCKSSLGGNECQSSGTLVVCSSKDEDARLFPGLNRGNMEQRASHTGSRSHLRSLACEVLLNLAAFFSVVRKVK